MIFGSVCSGIEAASVAWHSLGWRAAWFSEIEPFPCAVLSHHYPHVPNLGDMTKFQEWHDAAIDLLVGGTPCQSFSIAGLRKGLDDPRGNLMLVYLAIARRYTPRWVVWENVPGMLSSNGGRDFGAFLGGLAELGYGFAWRVLDAQYIRVESHARAVPQRRRRVFVVGYSGDWRCAAAVLFERASLLGHPPPRRKPGQDIAATLTRGADSSGKGGYAGRRQEDDTNVVVAPTLNARTRGGGGHGPDFDCGGGLIPEVARTLKTADERTDAEKGTLPIANFLGAQDNLAHYADMSLVIAHALCGEGFDASEDGTGRGTPLVPVPFDTTQITSTGNRSNPQAGGPCHPLAATAHAPAIAFDCKAGGDTSFSVGAVSGSLRGEGHGGGHAAAVQPFTLAVRGRDDGYQLECRQDGTANAVLTPNGGRAGTGVGAFATGAAVRRLTPRECERLQGFSDDYTRLPLKILKHLPDTKHFMRFPDLYDAHADGSWTRYVADGPRYKALGNSMAIPPMRWIGERIAMVEALVADERSTQGAWTP